MRAWLLSSLALLVSVTATGAEAPPTSAARPWPLWDGAETIEQYARRAKLEPTKTLDLGSGVKLEMVLIPAGKFVMGTEGPESPWIGGAFLLAGGSAALVLLAMAVTRAIRQRRRLQFSLRWLILLVAVLGVAQYGGFRWRRAAAEQRSFLHFEETPTHEVTISAPFYLGRYEVTQEQYRQVIETSPSHTKGPDLPVEMVSWDDARQFCKKVSEKTRQSVRLPTEAEWEYACRAGTTTRFCSGDADADLESVAWYGANSDGQTHPVGQKKSNGWGLYDVHGNVWEWCADRYADWYGDCGAVTDPQGASRGDGRVLRGGSWEMNPRWCWSAARGRDVPGNRLGDYGFRVVVSAPRTP